MSRQPDFFLSALSTDGRSGNTGAAWVSLKEDGGVKHISLRLSPGTSFSWDDGLVLTLFPREESEDRIVLSSDIPQKFGPVRHSSRPPRQQGYQTEPDFELEPEGGCDGDVDKMLRLISHRADKLSKWDSNFIKSINRLVDDGAVLTDKQIATLDKICRRAVERKDDR